MSLPSELARNASRLNNPTTTRKLQETYPYLDWLDFMNAMLPKGMTVDENEKINNIDPKFFDQLGDVLKETPKRTVANYVFWRAIYSISNYLTKEIRDVELEFNKVADGVMKRQEQWKECISETNNR